MGKESDSGAKRTLAIPVQPGKSEAQGLADIAINPLTHAMAIAEQFNRGTFGQQGTTETFLAIKDQAAAVAKGDLTFVRQMLVGQAITLNAMFTELARRGGLNMGEYIKAAEVYLRLAMKAQAQSRATIEALERLTNGHVQTVKHVHVNEGGQAVIADEFHHHAGGGKIGQSPEQPHATGPISQGEALPSPEPDREAVPVARRARQ